ncbi:hypothetical protein [Allomuricauda sp.]|uniref:hypothetical protein n=1 Tax=Flagellimonas alginolytica TaxID=3177515 RepID=UPI0025FC3FA8|nr:hypothetical protein [Allomuricauda sp.]
MKIKRSFFLFITFTLIPVVVFSQKDEEWNAKELEYYKTIKGLSDYIVTSVKISKDTLFDKYIFFDNVLDDTNSERKKRRIRAFDTIFHHIPSTIDSIGIENLDAKPIRFFKTHKIYEPFEKNLKGFEKDVLVYYLKDDAENPLGYLLFEENSSKLASWILLNQGDQGWFFLTFNLL